MTIRNILCIAAGSMMVALAGPPAISQAPAPLTVPATTVKSGFLTCDEASGWGFVVVSTRDLKCTYTSASGTAERYIGHIDKAGVDLGYVAGGIVVWGVLAPTTELGKGALVGTYYGVTGGATIAGGGNANVLVGGSRNSISLQPLSLEGLTGLNVAAGVTQIVLQTAPE